MNPKVGTLQTYEDIAAISRQACDDLKSLCENAIDSRGVCRIALAGGSTPKLLYGLMADQNDEFDWQSIHFFLGDERNVPLDDDQSNYRMVREALLDRVTIPDANVHPVPIDPDDPKRTAEQYEATLRSQFGTTQLQWDLVLLGMGDDAHTASLFPETDAISRIDRSFVENWVEKLDTFRLTLTASAINSSRNVWFLLGGAGKREALAHVWGDKTDTVHFPSQLIKPAGELRWMVAKDALPTAEL